MTESPGLILYNKESAAISVRDTVQELCQAGVDKMISVKGQKLHFQGFAVDTRKEHIYWSFTDCLVKTCMDGRIIRQEVISDGHLGDITYYNGNIYGTMERGPLPGHAWDDWTGFCIDVFNEELKLQQQIELPQVQEYYIEKTNGICGVDGIAFGKSPEGGIHMMLGCGLFWEPKYDRQVILQFSPEGRYEKEYLISTGNTPYGIQNLEYEADRGYWWFSTYPKEKVYQSEYNLFQLDGDIKTILGKWKYSTPYGLASLGGGKFLTSADTGGDGDHAGYAYLSSFSSVHGIERLE